MTSEPLSRAPGFMEPYPGPRPFRVADARYFRGRDREIADLLSLIAGYRLVLVYGLSGVGKSSVVTAGVRPLIEGLLVDGNDERAQVGVPAKLRGLVVRIARVSGVRSDHYPRKKDHTNIYVHNLLASIDTAGFTPATSSATLSTHLRMTGGVHDNGSEETAQSGGLLIIDQFEEILTAYPDRWEDRAEFFKQLGQVLEEQPRLRVVLVAREEHVPALERYGDHLPDDLRIRYRVERLRPHEAEQAIVTPAEQAAKEAEAARSPHAPACRKASEFLQNNCKTLLSNLQQTPLQRPDGRTERISGEFIEPLQLQIVCRSLWSKNVLPQQQKPRREIKLETDVEEVLSTFYANAITRAARLHTERHQPAALKGMVVAGHDTWNAVRRTFGIPSRLHRWVTRELITPMRTRSQVFLDAKSGTAAGLQQGLVEALEKEHLIRSEVRGGTTWYELTHDRFIYAIDALDAERRRRLIRMSGGALALMSAVVMVGTVLLLKKPDIPPTADPRAAAAITELKEVKAAERKREDLAKSYIDEGLKLLLANDPAAGDLFEKAQTEDPLAGLRALNANTLLETNDRAHEARASYIRQLRLDDRSQATNRELSDAVCETPVTVIGASEPTATATGELARFKKAFPVATLSKPRGRYQAVLVSQFVSCETASKLVSSVNSTFGTGAFVENEFRVCKGCPTLPQSFRNPRSTTTVPGSLEGYRIGLYYLEGDADLDARARALRAALAKSGFGGTVTLYPRSAATLAALVPASVDEVRYDEPDEIDAVDALIAVLATADKGRQYQKVRSWSNTPRFMSIFLAGK